MSRAPAFVIAAALAINGCDARDARETAREPVREPVTASPIAPLGDTARSHAAVVLTPFRTIGRTATRDEIQAWDIDVNGAGVGLPPGRGTYERGTAVFAQQCASCHGPKGEGLGANPRLVGAEPRDFSLALDTKIPNTIGNYWPYATTLYDYINRAMPFTAPGSLKPDDVYSVIAFLLAENGIVERKQVMDATSLPRVHMPAHERFVRDDRAGGPTFR